MEEKVHSIQQHNIIFCLLLILVLTFFLTINFLTPSMGEDFVLSAYSPYEHSDNYFDLFQKVVNRVLQQMRTWNVRLGEQLSIVFSCFNRPLFGIINSFVALYYFWLIVQYAFCEQGHIKNQIYGLAISFTITLLFQPALGEIFFWRTGSANYLWALCILLTFILPLRYYLSTTTKDIIGNSKVRIISLTILGFFAGFTNENTVGTFIILYMGIIVYYFLHKNKLPIWIYTSFLSFLLGFTFLILAPSTAIRISTYNEIYGVNSANIITYISRIPSVINRFCKDNWKLAVIVMGCVSIAFLLSVCVKKNQNKEEIYYFMKPLAWLLLTAFSCGALILSPYVETRAFFLTDFMMVVCIAFYSKIIWASIKNKITKYVFVFVLAISVLICENKIYNVYKIYNEFCSRREVAILSSEKDCLWGEYMDPYVDRILTTREEYLREKEYDLSVYFNKKVNIIPGLLWERNRQIETYVDSSDLIIGGIDCIEHEINNNKLFVSGWAALPNIQSHENKIYIIILLDGKKYYYKSTRIERPDVAKALEDNLQLNCGYQLHLDLPQKIENADKIKIGVCVVNYKMKVFAEIFY